VLNYIWLGLIVIGLLAAGGRDAYDASKNSYGNGVPISCRSRVPFAAAPGAALRGSLLLTRAECARHFSLPESDLPDSVVFPVTLYFRSKQDARAVLEISDRAPEIFRTIAEAQGGKGTAAGIALVRQSDSAGVPVDVTLDPVRFIFLRKVTNAAFDAAGLAVQIAIGLIGIMTLWLGVMKIAEEAGLIRLVVRLVRPVTRRLFPDIPPDDEAIGSIVMNVSANLLGLGNAATPFGLKAMEQLNRLNPSAGQASNAMVTFLAMNTSCVTLIPATAIAVRASMGSQNPAAIIGPTFLASLVATVCGVLIAKLLQRLRIFALRKEEA
jgi:spore maturation protein A